MGKHDERLARQAQEQSQREQVLYEVKLIVENQGEENEFVKLGLMIRETTGLDETLVLRKLGKDFQPTGGGALMFRNAMLARSIVKIKKDGGEYVPFDRTKADDFLNNLGSRAKAVLDAAYSAVNDLTEEERNAVKNEISPTIGI